MKVITAHRERVARLENAMDRLLELERLLHDTRSESWRLRSQFSKANEIIRGEAQEKIAEYEQEIALMTGMLATQNSAGAAASSTVPSTVPSTAPPAGAEFDFSPATEQAAASAR